ncbi:MAG: N-acetylmuramoyl-L-alanine amidase [Clostridia bacterium]|nr:N-acetylmuramoyl-L-alanine amidase [Clostridia bacterium]
MKRFRIAALLLLTLAFACGTPQEALVSDTPAPTIPVTAAPEPTEEVETVAVEQPTPSPLPTLPPTPTPTPKPTPVPPLMGVRIGLDPGHQQRPDVNPEPIAPNEEATKARCSSGTRGIVTGIYEYEVNLAVALKLKTLLEQNGATVFITRTTNDVNISNRERAAFFNENEVDLAVRLHCNGTDDTSVRGAFMLLPEKERTAFYSENNRAATAIIEQYCKETGLEMRKRNGLTYSSSQTGFNWCTRPIVCIEMGHLSNESEDLLLTSDTFQAKMAVGILNGILTYFDPNASEGGNP